MRKTIEQLKLLKESENMVEFNKGEGGNTSYHNLVTQIGDLLNAARGQVAKSVNDIMVRTYWSVGQHIVEFEQKGELRAEYGKYLLDNLSRDLTNTYGKGFSRSNVFMMRQFYLKFQKVQTLSGQLSWSHYIELLKLDDPLEISFYVAQCEKENWSVRELQRQLKSMLFHRLALSKDKEQILELANSGMMIQKAEDIIKDPYVLEFAGISEQSNYLESDLEKALINNLQQFLLELGKGFAFIGRQYRISIGGKHFYVDLVFYHRILKCFVLIDLKRGEIEHSDIGQMNLYLNYFRKEEMTEGDHEPIGIVLGAAKDNVLVEYATEGITNQLFVSKYQLYLPDRDLLQRELEKVLQDAVSE